MGGGGGEIEGDESLMDKYNVLEARVASLGKADDDKVSHLLKGARGAAEGSDEAHFGDAEEALDSMLEKLER
jgi:hypothetical protein